eukprot:2507203-Pyramimonas_sp.AAC.1
MLSPESGKWSIDVHGGDVGVAIKFNCTLTREKWLCRMLRVMRAVRTTVVRSTDRYCTPT